MSKAKKIKLNPHMGHGIEGETVQGQANLAYDRSRTCRECSFWGEGVEDYSKYKFGVGAVLSDQHCLKALSMAGGSVKLPKVPHNAISCKSFDLRGKDLPAKKLGGVDELELLEKAREVLGATEFKQGEFEEKALCSYRTFRNFALEITTPNKRTIERVQRAIKLLEEGQTA